MITICHILTKGIDGGVEAIVMNYCRQLKDSFHFEIMIENESKLVNKKTVSELGGELVIIPPYKHVFKYDKFLYDYFRKHPEIGIVQANLSTMSFLALREAKRAGIKVRIAESHSTDSKKELARSVLKHIFRHVTDNYLTDKFACSYAAGEFQFGKKAMDKGEVFIAPNGIDLDKFRFNEEKRIEARKELGLNDNDFVIGHIGRFVPQKNHRFLIDVFKEVHKEMPNSKLVLVGDGPLVDEVKKQTNDYGLTDSVIFTGTMADTSSIYNAFDCFAFPSIYEGLGMVAVEAQANGLPTIISTEVPDEAMVLNSTKKLPLDINKWVECISNSSREAENREVDASLFSDFDIKRDAVKLGEKYKELTKELN